MRLKFVTVQERANSLGLGVSKFRYVGVDSNGEKVRYNYRLFIANKEEAEDIKKEADRLMINKCTKYEDEIKEVKDDNKKLAKQITDLNK